MEEEEEDPRAELVRRLQEYERFKRASDEINALERLERDVVQTQAEVTERKIVTKLPDLALKELLFSFKEAIARSEQFAHLHFQREPLSVRECMSEILVKLQGESYANFVDLFDPNEGRTGVTVSFLAILELLKEALIDVVQPEPYGPIRVRLARKSALAQSGTVTEPA